MERIIFCKINELSGSRIETYYQITKMPIWDHQQLNGGQRLLLGAKEFSGPFGIWAHIHSLVCV